MASPIVKGQAFGTTETVTAAKLQNIVDNAAFKDFDGSTEVFNVSGSTDIGTCVLAGGLAVKTSTGQLQLKSQADQTVIGNVSGGAAVPTAVPIVGGTGILINDDALGTSDTKGATQGNIKAYVDSNSITQTTGSAPYFGVRAWAYYNGTSNSLVENGNIASVTKHGTGDYEFFFDVAMPDVNYAISLSYSNEVNNQHGVGFVVGHATGSCRIQFYNAANSANTMDKAYVAISVIR